LSKIEQIVTPEVSEPNPNIFSNCLKVGDQVFLSGMTAGDNAGGLLGDGSPEDQARQCLTKIESLVKEAGGTRKDIVKLTIYLTDIHHRVEFGKVREEFFQEVMPCSTLIEVSGFVQPEITVEVDAVAIIGAGGLEEQRWAKKRKRSAKD
jgi:enamine deaminase RidA (YjgF/YER057c/UK114 family)